ncbi:glycosyltransferase [Sporosarcina ureae]|uniref:glycosyltransferase n=1 Tax=Sporosarcina ureae TaxID=1571 RepID=UPI0028AC887E|nr:glycosyltransferase [Sporosarcina ureae]
MKEKALFISHMYIKENDKSYGKVIHEQAVSLIKRGYEVQVICPVPYTLGFLKYFNKKYTMIHDIPNKEIHDGVVVYYPRFISFPRSIFFKYSGKLMYLSLKNFIKQLKKIYNFNIIHAHFAMPDAYASMKISEYFKVPLITTLQASDLDITVYRNDGCKEKVKKTLEYSSEVISPTPRLKNQLFDLFNIHSYDIGYGIDTQKTKIKSSPNLISKYSGKNIIISVSRLLNSKGIDYNIKAIKKLKESHDIHYLIIGDGPEKENLIKLVEDLGLNDIVEFLGELNHTQTMQYISIADIFSLPSWQETFGLVYLEAMINGVPVIGCKGQGFDGIIEHQKNGYLAEPKDMESVYEIMDSILTNPQKVRLVVEKAEQTVLSEFTHQKISEKIEEVYDNVLNNEDFHIKSNAR